MTATRAYTPNLAKTGATGSHLLIAAVIQRAVEDARGNVFGMTRYGTHDTHEALAARKATTIAEARAWLAGDAAVWAAFMPTPDVWIELMEGVL